MAVAALDRHHRRQAEALAGHQHGPAGRVAVLRVQHVERLFRVFGADGFHHLVDVALEIAVFLLAALLETDDVDARH